MRGDTPKEAMFSIGQFAKLTGFSIKTLRYYDEEDILKPAVVDSTNGYRYYTEEQCRHVHLLAELHFSHLPVVKLREFMCAPTLEHQARMYDWRIQQLEEEQRLLHVHLRTLRRKRDHPWRGQSYEVMIEDRPAKPFVYCHYFTDFPKLEDARHAALETLRDFLRARGVTTSGPPISIGMPNHQPPDPRNPIEVYVGFEVNEPVEAQGDVECGATPGGRWYGVRHVGPYEHIWHVVLLLRDRVQQDGVRVSRMTGEFVVQERYLVGPWNETNVGKWETEVWWLVQPETTGSAVNTPTRW